jgi:hypothetical protein
VGGLGGGRERVYQSLTLGPQGGVAAGLRRLLGAGSAGTAHGGHGASRLTSKAISTGRAWAGGEMAVLTLLKLRGAKDPLQHLQLLFSGSLASFFSEVRGRREREKEVRT